MKSSVMEYGASCVRSLLVLVMLLTAVGCAAPQGGSNTTATEVSMLDDKPVMLKTVPRATYFTGQYDMPVGEIRERTGPLAQKVAVAAVKNAKLDIVGPLTLFLPDWRQTTSGDITLEMGYPVSGAGQPLAHYDRQSKGSFQCLTVTRAAGTDNNEAWAELYRIADEQALSISGENRTVITRNGSEYQVELQLGVR